MSKTVSWLLEMQVQEGHASDLKTLMAEMSSGTQANEPGTLMYEWSLSADGTICHLWERYVDSAAALAHGGTFVAKYAGRFLSVLKPVRCVVYGSPNEAVKQALAPFAPVYMAPAAGFSR